MGLIEIESETDNISEGERVCERERESDKESAGEIEREICLKTTTLKIGLCYSFPLRIMFYVDLLIRLFFANISSEKDK